MDATSVRKQKGTHSRLVYILARLQRSVAKMRLFAPHPPALNSIRLYICLQNLSAWRKSAIANTFTKFLLLVENFAEFFWNVPILVGAGYLEEDT